jgi:hypothetical protein
MKKKLQFSLFVLSIFFCQIHSSSKDIDVKQIINKCAEAMGGINKIKSLQTIRIHVKYQDHKNINIHEIKRPNLFRTTDDIGSYTLIFDGEKASFSKNEDGKTSLQLINESEMPDFVAEPGFFTFYFFDFPTTYLGKAKLDTHDHYHLTVKMPFAVVIDYYIDCTTNLLNKTVAHVIIKGKEIEWSREYYNYKSVDGISYPHGFYWYFGDPESKKEAIIHKVEFNVAFPSNHFNVSNHK